MLSYKWEITHYALIYFLFTPIILCEKHENKDNNRSKRTVGLFLQSLASFLNVQDVEATTPVTFTTSAPGYRRKPPPSKVQKWPPLDLEITPWVLSAVPTTTASPLTTSYPTTTIYPPTEEPGIHAQVIIIPLTEPENHLKPPVGSKKEPDVYLRPGDVNGHPLKYTAVQNYQNTQAQYQATIPYYHNPLHHQPTEVYFWQRLVPDQRTVKQIHYLNQQQPLPYQQLQQTAHHQQQKHTQLQTDHTQNQQSNNKTVKETSQKQFQLQPKEAEALFRLGYLYGQTIKDELSNLAGNDFNREKQDKYRSFIDVEPKFRYTPTASSKNNDLSQLYLLERSRRLKNVNNIMKLGSNRTKLKYNFKNNDESEKTDVEIVKSVEPVYFNIGFEEHPKEEKESIDYKTDNKEKLEDSPAFEMVKSYELPNSEILSGNKDFEFHMDPEENPEKNIYLNDEETFRYNVSEKTNKIISPIKNKKITFIPPSERQKYDQRKRIVGDQNSRINNYLNPDKIQDVYDDKQYIKYGLESFRDIISNENPKHEISKQEINHDTFRNRPVENPFKQFSYEFTEQSPDRGKVKFHQYGGEFSNNNQRYNDFISKYQSQKSLPNNYNNHNDFVKVENSEIQSQSHDFSVDPTKLDEEYNYFNGYNAHRHNKAYITDQNVRDTENKLNNGVNSNYNFSLQNPDAQLHIFIPDEQSLQSPEKQDKPLTSQQLYKSPEYYQDYTYQQGEPQHEPNIELKSSGIGIPAPEKPLTSQQLYSSPEYYQDYSYQQAEPQHNSNIEYKSSGVGIPRLPDNLHEQITEHNGVRRNLGPPPSFDQEADTSDHKVNCIPLPFTKLKFACKPILSLKLDQKLSK